MKPSVNALSVRSVSKSYVSDGKGLTVFEDLDFQVLQGDFLAILGPSGCGKSTILECIAGLKSYEGTIAVNGRTPAEAVAQKNIGFAFQEPGLVRWKTVLENVLLPAEVGKRTISSANAHLRASQLLKMVKLDSYAGFFPAQLSGGMKQRTALARALMLEPDLLLLDECFSALDGITRLGLMTEFNQILDRKRTSCIMITHNVEEAAFLADRIIILTDRPAKIACEIKVNYSVERDIALLNSEEFNAVAAKCRHQLFQYAQKI